MKYKLGEYPKPLIERDWHEEPYAMDNLVLGYARDKDMGALRSGFEICINAFGQNVASQPVQDMFPEDVQMLEDIFKNEKPVSAAVRAGAIIDGKPGIILTYSFDKSILNHKEVNDCNLLHAQTRMMAQQLQEALLGHSVNICATFNSEAKSNDEFADGIHAIIPASIKPEMRARFEKEFDEVLLNLALSKDFGWFKRQFEVLANECIENKDGILQVKEAFKAGCSVDDIVIEACGFLGQHIGGRQFLFDKAKAAQNTDKVHKLAEACDLSKNQGLLYKCLINGSLRAKHKGLEHIALYTRSRTDSLYSPKQDCFQITMNELRSILNEMGYAKDTSIPAFMCSYSHETAAEIKSVYENRNRKSLDRVLCQAEEKRNGNSKDAGALDVQRDKTNEVKR